MYRQRYWHKTIFDAIDNLKALSEKHDIDLVSASLRWMRHHSALTGNTRAIDFRYCCVYLYQLSFPFWPSGVHDLL